MQTPACASLLLGWRTTLSFLSWGEGAFAGKNLSVAVEREGVYGGMRIGRAFRHYKELTRKD
jgi:hypothetical protein